MSIRKLILSILFAGCSHHGSSPTATQSELVQSLYASTLEQLESASADNAGYWPSATDCDASLWAGEARAANDQQVQIQDALTSQGRPTRLPGQDCTQAQSTATTSTDGRIGTILGLLAAKDLASLELLQAYAGANDGVVGTPVGQVSLVVMKPTERTLLGRAVVSLGGIADTWSKLPIVWTPPQTDSDVHLEQLAFEIERLTQTFGDADVIESDATCHSHSDDALVLVGCGLAAQSATIALSPHWVMPTYVRGALPAYALTYKLDVLHQLVGDE